MALGTERRQASLIGGGELPSARLANTTPDLSGLSRLGAAFLNKDADNRATADAEARQKQAILDELKGQEAGATYGQSWVGKDANGNAVEVQLPMEQSPSYIRGYLNGFDQTQDGKFRASLEGGLNGIQQRYIAGEITASEATALMQSFVTGAAEGAPAHRKGYYSELGQTELLQRSTLMGTQEASRKAEIVVKDLTAGIEDEVNRAAAHASAGGDPAPFLSRIDAAYDNLFDLGRIGGKERDLGKQGARELVVGQALVNRLTSSLAKGEITPEEIDALGTAIETNNSEIEVVVNKTYQVGPMAKSSVPQGYRSKDVIANISNERLRQQMGQKMRQAAGDYAAAAKAQAGLKGYTDTLKNLSMKNGRYAKLPSGMRDDADAHAAAVMAGTDIYGDPQARAGMLKLLEVTKYVPKAVANEIQLKAGSSNPQHIEQAIALYREIAYLRNDWGDDVGTALRESLPEDVRNLIEPMDAAYRAGVSPDQIARNMLEARGKEEFTVSALVRDYNLVKGEDFYTGFRTRFVNTYGMPPDPTAATMFEQAYRHTMIMSRNPETSYEKAWEMVQDKFRPSAITMTGFETGSGTLTNPVGWEVKAQGVFGYAPGSEYEWINEAVREDLGEMLIAKTTLPDGTEVSSLVLPSKADGSEMTRDDFYSLIGPSEGFFEWVGKGRPVGPRFLGETIKLMPVPGTNPDMPEYNLMMFDREGNYLGPVMHRGKDGEQRRLIVNPHVERELASFKGQARLDYQTAADGTASALEDLDTFTVLQLPREARETYDYSVPLSEYLPQVAPDLAKEYQLERQQLEEGLEKARKTYEEKTGDKINRSQVGPQTLIQPKASGYHVAATAAKAIDEVLPDGTGGVFLMRIAAQESNFGMAPGTFRLSGDRGMTQVNDRTGFVEVKRRVRLGKGPVWAANEKLKASLGIDFATATADDLEKPIYAMAAARLYAEVVGKPIPQDVAGQARWWKRHYNTVLGAGTERQFVASAKKVPDEFIIEPTAGRP